MKDFNTYWVSTVARTGSMWITNVIKEIFANSNFNPEITTNEIEKKKGRKNQNLENMYFLCTQK